MPRAAAALVSCLLVLHVLATHAAVVHRATLLDDGVLAELRVCPTHEPCTGAAHMLVKGSAQSGESELAWRALQPVAPACARSRLFLRSGEPSRLAARRRLELCVDLSPCDWRSVPCAAQQQGAVLQDVSLRHQNDTSPPPPPAPAANNGTTSTAASSTSASATSSSSPPAPVGRKGRSKLSSKEIGVITAACLGGCVGALACAAGILYCRRLRRLQRAFSSERLLNGSAPDGADYGAGDCGSNDVRWPQSVSRYSRLDASGKLLPRHWHRGTDPFSGKPFYYQEKTGVRLARRPRKIYDA